MKQKYFLNKDAEQSAKKVAKLNLFETHDRLEHFKKDQHNIIFEGAEECLKKNPDSLALQEKCPYIYLFAHPRLDDDGIRTRLLWQPRLTKPKAQSNSFLFRAISNTDVLEVCWLIPPPELWPQYQRGQIAEDPTVLWSINMFLNNKAELEAPAHDDWPDKKIARIWEDYIKSTRKKT